ncbi:TRAP transporter small permease [Cellulomonas fimi]|uniref:Tripartite ATP-independent periplasmic transporter DctQ component n=1 Tax=Cellulomonas fimi (strain ATCC 484 / DSM 20113 / JCM 1341 / CCUG 24087 / LMG 16345 / NBRC 15513 / NCIMB 8980 / NCTC 7547 / NRS-133) TaxID=590998 RepID=F4H1P1_CELFA|nr:TRAP transporter small permease [Cellulomonas fimi]AEE47461.1 Tripartite ATP-independent periplasmic transporter DctQ component [Cellulomonas fimi ATCC 484]NNH05562.1 TRAP transporter small permease [Cellulomonas fimi]VEH36287.1 2,3-diketo-L-gulonate TRAP transporter small permease protein yiaM [Cellulomonas fimi]
MTSPPGPPQPPDDPDRAGGPDHADDRTDDQAGVPPVHAEHALLIRFKAGLDAVLRTVCVTLFALLVLLVTWQVFTRLVLDAPSVWSEEAARYVFVWVSLIGVSIATGEKADVAIDYFVLKAPLAAQRVLEVVAYLATLTFAGVVMVWGGWTNAHQTWDQANPVLPVSAGVLYLAVPVAGVLFAFYLLYHLAGTLSRRYAGVEHTAPEEGVEL